MTHIPQFIPSPTQGVWHLGPLPIRAYALCIVAGIFAGYFLGRHRWVARGGKPEVIADITMWAVPFGLIGSRIYHVITDYELYFGEGRHPIDALKIWHGGLGVWGGVAFGLFGAWLAARRHGVPFLAAADAMAPGIALAQAIGRFGNYFNQELFGRPTTLPWGLEIDPGHRPNGYESFKTFHPTFLYEAIWDLGVMAMVILVDRRQKLGHGRALALYVAGYTAGRGLIEMLRIDTVNHVLGLRLNVWTSIILFVLAIGYFIWSARYRPGQEDITPKKAEPAQTETDSAEADSAEADSSEDTEAEEADGEKADAEHEGEPAELPAEQVVAEGSPENSEPADERSR
jgi:prolipoprotein diacylglyceryl transferase